MFNVKDKVKIKGTNVCGVIRSINNTNSNNSNVAISRNIPNNLKVIISSNGKTIETSVQNIELCDFKETESNKISVTYNRDLKEKYCDFSNGIPEIMLRHKTLDEAIFELDLFINECIAKDVKEVRIIHGKHGGIIRRGTHEYLRNNKNVISFRLGGYFEGQHGVTIAYLK